MPLRRRLAGRGQRGAAFAAGGRLILAAAILVGLFALPVALLPGGLAPVAIASGAIVPIEIVVAMALVALWPGRDDRGRGVRRAAAALLVALLALHALSLATWATLGRSFRFAFDMPLLLSAVEFAVESHGILLAMLAGGLILATVAAAYFLAVLCLGGIAGAARRSAALRAVVLLGCGTVVALQIGHWAAPGRIGPVDPVSDRIARDLLSQGGALAVRLADHSAYRGMTGEPARPRAALAELGGADVLLFMIESYGRSSIEDPRYGGVIVPALRRLEHALRANGFDAVSGWLESPTLGGQSWLAHASLLSGLWVDNQFRYDLLLSGERRTLVDDFAAAGYRTVLMEPAIDRPWPEVAFYGFDRTYFSWDMGYAGPRYDWVTMPDQYSLAVLDRAERRAPGRKAPLFATTVLISSHAPWTPVAEVVEDWSAIGDGRIFAAWADPEEPPQVLWQDAEKVRRQYGRAMRYVIDLFAAYFAQFGERPTLLFLVGDHQPGPIISGAEAGRDVPIHVVSNDPALLRPFRAWGFVDGVLPGPDGAAMRMDGFRDSFLGSFRGGERPVPTGGDRP